MRQVVKLYPDLTEGRGSTQIPLDDGLLNETPERINRFVLFQLQRLRTTYRRYGNPLVVYNDGNRVAAFLSDLAVKRIYQLGCLHQFLGYLLIASNESRASIEIAEAHIRLALTIFDAHDQTTMEVISHLNQALWLLGICMKMQGHPNDALVILDDALSDPYLRRFSSPTDRVPLIRQMVIMAQESQSFRALGNSLQSHRASPVEYFHSVKRLFEFSLNSHDLQSARRLFSECEAAFANARLSLESVHVAAYYKSVFLYFRLMRQDILAESILRNTLAAVNRLGLYGQKRQLLSLANQFGSKTTADIRLDVAVY